MPKTDKEIAVACLCSTRFFFSRTARSARDFWWWIESCLGTIQILRQHYFGLFLTHSLCHHKYTTERQQNWPFFYQPIQVFADVICGRPLSFGSHIWCAHYRTFIVERTLFPSNYASWKLIWWQSKTAQCTCTKSSNEFVYRNYVILS
jgi:hypothetical protein